MNYVKLSRRAGRDIMDALSRGSVPNGRALAELERALATKPRPLSSAKKKTAAKKREKRTRTDAVRDAVKRRAGPMCECGCGRWFRGFEGAAQLDHFFGVARAESLQTCWLIRADCHDAKTRNLPGAIFWLEKFIAHADRHGYLAAARKARARLDARSDIRAAAALTEGRG